MENESFTLRFRRIITAARKIAKLNNKGYYTTMDILLSIINETNCFAVKILQRLGVDITAIRKIVSAKIYKNDIFQEIPRGKINLQDPVPTKEVESIVKDSVNQASKYSHLFIGTEHILLSVLDTKTTVSAGELLESLNITYQQVDKELRNLSAESSFTKSDEENSHYEKASGPEEDDEEKFNLEDYCRNLNELARTGKLDPIIGREKEIKRIIQVLSRRRKNNPILIGEAGVGKTAIIEGLTQKIVLNKVPPTLNGKQIYQLNLSSLVAGTKYRGQFEGRMKSLIETIRNKNDLILFIDEIHTIVGAGSAEGSLDASHILKPALARGELKCIGATTIAEFHRFFEKDGALKRRFQPIVIESPSIKETIDILIGLKESYEEHHGVKYSENALKSAAVFSDRYITDRQLPDKAIDIIDEAGARVKLSLVPPYPQVEDDEVKLKKIIEDKFNAVSNQQYAKAAELREKELKLRLKIEEKQNDWLKLSNKIIPNVTEDDVREAISMWTNIPLQKLEEKEQEKLLKLEELLSKKVISQESAIKAVSRAIRRGRMGLKEPNRPMGSFLFLGPTGVGKTELAKALAEILFGSKGSLIRIDMSEYMEKYSVSRLIGSPPGYVGFGEQNPIIEQIRVKPYSVVLFDEIEKAHTDVLNIMLQLFEEGEITDSVGRKISFRQTVVIMTSNIGTKQITRSKPLGFSSNSKKIDYIKMKENILSELKREINPEILNRIDEIIVFKRLSENDMNKIVDLVFIEISERIKEKGITIELSNSSKELLIDKGYDIAYGARPLKKAFRNFLEDPLVEEMLKGNINIDDNVLIERDGKNLRFIVLDKEKIAESVLDL